LLNRAAVRRRPFWEATAAPLRLTSRRSSAPVSPPDQGTLRACCEGERPLDDERMCVCLPAVGVEADSERIQKLLAELAGKDLLAVLAEGKTKLAAMPAAGPAAAAPAAGAAPAAKKEEKKVEKEESDQVRWVWGEGREHCSAMRGSRVAMQHVPHGPTPPHTDGFSLCRTWASPSSTSRLAYGTFFHFITCIRRAVSDTRLIVK
jgi:ribosomal protein L12E/L44/L45/RPP1/RPP2